MVSEVPEKNSREKMAQRVVRLSPNERDPLAHLDAQSNKAGCLKALIRADIERNRE